MNRQDHRAFTGHLAMVLWVVIFELTGLRVDLFSASVAVLFIALSVQSATWPDIDQRIPFMTHRGRLHTLEGGFLIGVLTTILVVITLDLIRPHLQSFPVQANGSLLWTIGGYFGAIMTFSWVTHLLGDFLSSSVTSPVRVSWFASEKWHIQTSGPWGTLRRALDRFWPWSLLVFLTYLGLRFVPPA